MQNITPEQLKRYFNGQCTSGEKAQVEQWLSSTSDSPERDDVFEGIDKGSLKDQLWEAVEPASWRGKKRAHSLFLLKLAASFLLLVSAAGLIYQYQPFSLRQEFPAVAEYKVVKAERGKKITLTLSDGTIVHLNAGSELSIPVHFSDTARSVRLTGEAYLEVAKDISRPFTVMTPAMAVRVVGTRFNVRAYPGEAISTVTVEEGKVRVSDNAGQLVLLTRDQMATYSLPDKALLTQNVDAKNYTAWRERMLVFKDQPLSEIAATLERWYDVQLEIKNKTLATHRFTGQFNNPTLTTVMEDMSAVIHFNYELNEKRLIIY